MKCMALCLLALAGCKQSSPAAPAPAAAPTASPVEKAPAEKAVADKAPADNAAADGPAVPVPPPAAAPPRAKPALGEVRLPRGFPKFPIYPGARFVGSGAIKKKHKRVLTAMYETPDDDETVRQFYSGDRFSDFNVKGGDKTIAHPLRVSAPAAHADVRLSIARVGDVTSIQLVVTPW
jgi:hypothetical protein